jgi:putative ABC transport system substrate-binding protein
MSNFYGNTNNNNNTDSKIRINKKFSIILAALLICFAVFSYVNKSHQKSIIIINYNHYSALMDVQKGIKYELPHKDLKITTFNADGSYKKLINIHKLIKSRKKDIIICIGVNVSRVMKDYQNNSNILISAVTDPVSSGIVKTLENKSENITGISDKIPINEQLNMALKVKKDLRCLGVIFKKNEPNSLAQIQALRDLCKIKGIQLKLIPIEYNTNLKLYLTRKFINNNLKAIDCIIIPSDEVVAPKMSEISQIAHKYKIPVVGSEKYQLKNGADASVGISYYSLGRQTGKFAVRILNGERAKDMSFETERKVYFLRNNTRKGL